MNGYGDGFHNGYGYGYKKGHEKASGTDSRRVKRNFRLLRGLVRGAALLLFAGLAACTPPAGGSLDGFHRETIPDLKEELYLVAEFAERAEIVNPRYAGTNTAEWEDELAHDTYTIPPRAGAVQLSPREIYPKDEAEGNFLLGTYPNQFFSDDASAAGSGSSGSGDRLFSVNSGDNTISIYDESTLELTGVLDLGQNVSPWAAALSSAEADKIFVTGWKSHTVYAADLSSGEILWERDLSQGLAPDGGEDGGGASDGSEVTGKAPEGIVYYDNGSDNGSETADGDYLFVTVTNYQNFSSTENVSGDFGEGYVVVLDASDGEIVNAVSLERDGETGSNPQSLFIDYARDELHVICTGTNGGAGSDDGEVVILDIKGDEEADDALLNGGTSSAVITRLPVGGSPVVSASAIDWDNRVVYLAGVKYMTAYYMGSETSDPLESSYSPPKVLHGSADPILEDESDRPLYGAVAVYRPNKPADSEDSDESAPESKLFVTHFPEDQLIVLQLPDDPLTAAPGDYTELGKIDTGDGPKFLLMHTEED